MSGGYVVFPEGDFDGNAIVVDADSPEDAARAFFEDGCNGPFGSELDLSDRVCVLPFQDVQVFVLKIEVDK